jgi:hypothetical protein
MRRPGETGRAQDQDGKICSTNTAFLSIASPLNQARQQLGAVVEHRLNTILAELDPEADTALAELAARFQRALDRIAEPAAECGH